MSWFLKILAVLAVSVGVLVSASAAQASTKPEPKAKTSLIWGPTVCGFWANGKVYIPCRYGYMRRRIRDRRNILEGKPWRSDYRYIYTSLAQVGDYGPNSWFARFRFLYNEPGPLHRARSCKATMIVNARNGKVIRLQNKVGRCG